MVAVVNSFLSYLLMFVVIIGIALIGAFIGIALAKRKNAKAEAATATEEKKEEDVSVE